MNAEQVVGLVLVALVVAAVVWMKKRPDQAKAVEAAVEKKAQTDGAAAVAKAEAEIKAKLGK